MFAALGASIDEVIPMANDYTASCDFYAAWIKIVTQDDRPYRPWSGRSEKWSE